MRKQSALNFQVLITQDEDGVFVANVPAIPGCHTQGKTYEEVLRNIKDAIKLCLSVAKEDVQYRRKIDWPGRTKRSRLLGVVNLPVPSPLSAT